MVSFAKQPPTCHPVYLPKHSDVHPFSKSDSLSLIRATPFHKAGRQAGRYVAVQVRCIPISMPYPCLYRVHSRLHYPPTISLIPPNICYTLRSTTNGGVDHPSPFAPRNLNVSLAGRSGRIEKTDDVNRPKGMRAGRCFCTEYQTQ